MPQATKTPDLLQGTLDVMILRTLSRGSSHGYAIARDIERASAGELTIEEGSLYPALHRLLKRGDLTADWRKSETGRRARFYALSSKGKARLAEEVELWKRLSGAVTRVLGAGPGDAEAAPTPYQRTREALARLQPPRLDARLVAGGELA